MGYTTDFNGRFNLNKKLDHDTKALLVGLNQTRRMARNVVGYGVEGEFYIEGEGFLGQDNSENVINHNKPPKTQPSLWNQWCVTADEQGLEWDGGEKFYEYVAWLEYLVEKVLAPKGYILNGFVQWRGEDFGDIGTIEVTENKVTAHDGKPLVPTTELVVYVAPKPKRSSKPKALIDADLLLAGHYHNGKYYLESTKLIEALKLAHEADAITGLTKWIEEISIKRTS